VYPWGVWHVNGKILAYSQHNYNAHPSAPGQLPPVNAFWSVTNVTTASHSDDQKSVSTAYLINRPWYPQLKKNVDGSVTIYIPKDSRRERPRKQLGCGTDEHGYLVNCRLYWPHSCHQLPLLCSARLARHLEATGHCLKAN